MKRLITLILFLAICSATLPGCLSISFNLGGSVDTMPRGHTVSSQSAPTFEIEEQVIYHSNGIKITALGFSENGLWGPEIELLVENYTDKNIVLSGYDYIVNGIVLEGTSFINVAAGQRARGVISLLKLELDIADITEIATISAYSFSAHDADTLDNICDIPFEIRTSIAGTYAQVLPSHGDIIFQQEGITISACGVTDSLMYQSVVLMVTNETGKDITIHADNEAVNGFTISTYMNDEIYIDTARYCSLDFSTANLKDSGIEKIKNATFTLEIRDILSGKTIAETGELQVYIKD